MLRGGSPVRHMLVFASGVMATLIIQTMLQCNKKEMKIITMNLLNKDNSVPNGDTGNQKEETLHLVEPESHQIPPTKSNTPTVYMFRDGSLKLMPGFCRFTPQYDCAAMDTEKGPMPVYIHSGAAKDPNGYSVSGALLHKKIWEPRIVRNLLKEMQKYPEAGIVDIGCNLGPFSLHAARLGRKVISVDAVTDNILKLCKSVGKNNLTENIVMITNPVFDEHTMVELQLSPPMSYETTKLMRGQFHTGNYVCSDDKRVPTVMLDDLLSVITFKTAILKVDVESFEFYVVNGGKKFFEEINVPSILMEWEHVKKTGKGRRLAELLKTYRYIPFSMSDNEETNRRLDFENFMTWTHDVLLIKEAA